MTKTARVYKIELLLRSRGCVSFRTLQDELEVSRATLKRDLEYLRDQLGAPIEYDRFDNGYRIVPRQRGPKHELPGLWFSERELYSLLMANQLLGELDADGTVSRHLQPALERIHQLLGAGGAGFDGLLRRVKIISPAKRPVPGRFFELIGEALMQRRRVRMTYLTRGRGEQARRDVSAQRLVHYRNTWYLDGWCHTRSRLLRFALDAVREATLLPDAALDIDVAEVEREMDRGYGAYAGAAPEWVTLVFNAQAAQWVGQEQWHPDQQGRWRDDGSYELRVPYTDATELAMDVMRHGSDVRIADDTGTLRELVGQRLRQAYEVHVGQA
jgi:predicted DNA-binding transcriptional regulator YafY